MTLESKKIRNIGWLWFCISPMLTLLFLFGLSTAAEGPSVNLLINIVAWSFFLCGTAGVISGLGLVFQQKWACFTLRVLAWTYFIFFSGYIIGVIIFSIWEMINGNIGYIISILLCIPIFLMFALPWLLMAMHLKEIQGLLSKRNAA